MIEFRIKDHSVRPNVKVIEVWMNGKFKAAIYPTKLESGIRLVSTHILNNDAKQDVIDATILFSED